MIRLSPFSTWTIPAIPNNMWPPRGSKIHSEFFCFWKLGKKWRNKYSCQPEQIIHDSANHLISNYILDQTGQVLIWYWMQCFPNSGWGWYWYWNFTPNKWLKTPKNTKNVPEKVYYMQFLRSIWKILHLTVSSALVTRLRGYTDKKKVPCNHVTL